MSEMLEHAVPPRDGAASPGIPSGEMPHPSRAAAPASSATEAPDPGDALARQASAGTMETGDGPPPLPGAEPPDPSREAASHDAGHDDGAAGEGASGRRRWNDAVAPAAPAAPAPAEAAEVTFSAPGGSYPPGVTLYLRCATGDAEIRYTEDGSEPTRESALYPRGEALVLTASTVVSARAFAPGMRPGPVAAHRYALQAPRWRTVEPEDRADPVDHQCSDFVPGFASGWSLAAASTRGRLHAHRGAWREDAYAFARRGEWIILAVSDGAGSAPLSRVGSRTACDRAVEELRMRLPEHPPRAADEEALKAAHLPALRAQLANAGRAALNGLREAAAIRSQPVEALAATLLLAVLCPWGGGYLVAALQVGDGQVALLTRGESGDACTLLGEADHGAHSSETRFLTTRGVEEAMEHRVRFALPGRLAAVALMTDGISDDFFPEDRRLVELFTAESLPSMTGGDGAPLQGVMRGVAGAPDPGRALAGWIEYERKGSSDDRTLLLLWARG